MVSSWVALGLLWEFENYKTTKFENTKFENYKKRKQKIKMESPAGREAWTLSFFVFGNQFCVLKIKMSPAGPGPRKSIVGHPDVCACFSETRRAKRARICF